MPRSKSKDSYGKVNAENISGSKVPRRGGLSNQIQKTPTTGMGGAPQTFSKVPQNPTNSHGATGKGLTSALSGSKPTRSGRGGRGPTLGPVG